MDSFEDSLKILSGFSGDSFRFFQILLDSFGILPRLCSGFFRDSFGILLRIL